MRHNPRFLVVIVAIGAVAAGVLGWQHHTAEGLRRQIAQQRAQSRELARLNTENQWLVAAQPTTQELEQLFADRKAIAQLRAELDTMHRRAEAAARVAAGQKAAGGATEAAPSMTGSALTYKLWRNAGQATPDAAFETVLWAAAGGEVETVADLLAFDAEARSRAAALFAQLPESIRNELGTPERLVALLVADDVPLGRATILGQYPSSTETWISAQIFDADGTVKMSSFSFRAEGDRWRLVVPGKVVERYAAKFRSP